MFSIQIANHSGDHVEFKCGKSQNVLEVIRTLKAMNKPGFKEISIPYACKVGGCGLCKVKVIEGDFESGTCSETALCRDERTRGYALACKLFPRGDMRILIL